MNSFLYQVAKYIKTHHANNYDQVALVFPNRRSGLFFRKFFAEQFDQAVWSPNILTTTELVQHFTELQIPDHLLLLFELYTSYQEVANRQEPFDEFYFWGTMILNDFDQTDKQLVTPKELFTNLSDIKKIDHIFDYLTEDQKRHIEQFWGSLKHQDNFSYQKEFVRLWELLYPLYERFTSKLRSQGLAYEGMLLRDAVDSLPGCDSPFPMVYFVGLNALNLCEQKIMSILQKRKQAGFFWDYDTFYLNNNYHLAGEFLRQNLLAFPMPENFPVPIGGTDSTGQAQMFNNSGNSGVDKSTLFSNLGKNGQNLTVYPVGSQIMQVKTAHSLLSELPVTNPESPIENALILPDEKLLFPMLSTLPEKFKLVNITMGYPIEQSSTYTFIESLIDLHKNKRTSGKAYRFYYKHLLAVLEHPSFFVFDNEFTSKLREDIIGQNLVYIEDSTFLETDNNLVQLFISHLQTPQELILLLKNSLSEMAIKMEDNETKNSATVQLEKEITHQFYLTLTRFESLFVAHPIDMGIPTFIRFFKQAVQQISLPLSGEPLKGLQIMGVLETRALDFENVVILSLNEGSFPKRQGDNSFIPYNLRKGFGLPVNDQQDAIATYHFYRAIQRARHVHLVYNTESTDFGKSEMSRFLYQLKFDSSLPIKTINTQLDVNLDQVDSIVIEKTEAVWADLERYCSPLPQSPYLSPSALNDYLICSLRFYYKYVASIKTPNEISEEVDALIFGNILHESIEKLYAETIGKSISEEEFNIILKNDKHIREVLKEMFAKEFFKSKKPIDEITIAGKNAMAFEVLLKYLKQIIKVDKQQAPIHIVGLEEKVACKHQLGAKGKMINLGGTIDRVDKPSQFTRIVDYKTGADKRLLKDPSQLFERGQRKEFKAIFQLMLYAFLFKQSKGIREDIDLGLYLTKELFQENYSAMVTLKGGDPITYDVLKDEFEAGLADLINEIFDRETPFTQVEDVEVCEYCDYKELCRRVM